MQFSEGSAQQVGIITGQVLDAQSLAPVASMQAFITELNIGGLTGSNGRYLLTNVPAGTHTLTAQRIGYGTVSRQIQVIAGETVVVNFEVAEEALALSEIIVTGTPGGTQRRAIGNDVVRVDVAASMERLTRAPHVTRVRSDPSLTRFALLRGIMKLFPG